MYLIQHNKYNLIQYSKIKTWQHVSAITRHRQANNRKNVPGLLSVVSLTMARCSWNMLPSF